MRASGFRAAYGFFGKASALGVALNDALRLPDCRCCVGGKAIGYIVANLATSRIVPSATAF